MKAEVGRRKAEKKNEGGKVEGGKERMKWEGGSGKAEERLSRTPVEFFFPLPLPPPPSALRPPPSVLGHFLRYWLPLIVYCLVIFFQSSFKSPLTLPSFDHIDKVLHIWRLRPARVPFLSSVSLQLAERFGLAHGQRQPVVRGVLRHERRDSPVFRARPQRRPLGLAGRYGRRPVGGDGVSCLVAPSGQTDCILSPARLIETGDFLEVQRD